MGGTVTVLVASLGDIMLDVIVEAPEGLAPDDDVPASITFAAGGQAANVAAWVTAVGGRARLFGPQSPSGNGQLIAEALQALGVEVSGPTTSRPGTVMSLVTQGARSIASDPGSSDWLEHVAAGPWLEGADWLFVSGYSLMRSPCPGRIVEVAAVARSQGTKVAVDLSSAAMILDYGAARFRELWQRLEPAVVFANDHEWLATNVGHSDEPPLFRGAGGRCVLVLKHGSRGCTFLVDDLADTRLPVPGPVRDVTGAGDSLTAGYLVGGPDLAMETAARCVAQVGAQPTHPMLAAEPV